MFLSIVCVCVTGCYMARDARYDSEMDTAE